MGIWPFNSNNNQSDNKDVSISTTITPDNPLNNNGAPPPTNYTPGERYFLQDTKPKYSDDEANTGNKLTFKQGLDSIKVDDFKPENLVATPCFRDAGLLGFTAMFVSGSVIFLFHKNINKAINWSLGGLFLGSIVGWEQCRLKRQNEFRNSQIAREKIAKKELEKKTQNAKNQTLIEEWNLKNDKQEQKKSWYKFW
ncbi:related to Cytochrome c oxidase protein 20, mitochondrial [Saccharomycodes ludwigii]|uniref:Cytochrome c oxidase assembly protein COX20, mitochondrial n=1 Tax=Saccharomycodes ludwigii TaxID=36035 RepID=A0A376B5Q7_9ASCO|nr:hypothetical protein SCDLUD_001921 [Saccharomycodes ludwigii]KAH3902108.1 hypothetical protein SCDLUD_001921 [Saccharomycodes ludwigii]SSD60003.1 related to Cytochrome c oxidase protein 20, mitochondrial [Saccharomycodes ludwigii]